MISSQKSLRLFHTLLQTYRPMCSMNKPAKMQLYTDTEEEHLYRLPPITVRNNDGEEFQLETIVQDTIPEGSTQTPPRGTVVAVHGVPGSHRDFKYIVPFLQEAGIRYVGINFPGFGYTSFNEKWQHTNSERVRFVEAVLDQVVKDPKELIFMGHSRGTENALKMAVTKKDVALAAILVNPIGLRVNRALRPEWGVNLMNWLYDFGWLRNYVEKFIYFMYSRWGVKTANQFIAGLSFKTLTTCNFSDQPFYIDLVNASNLMIINVYSSKDHILEKSISEEFVSSFKNNKHFEHTGHLKTDEEDIAGEVAMEIAKGTKHISVNFAHFGHFMQRDKAYFLAETIKAILANKNRYS